MYVACAMKFVRSVCAVHNAQLFSADSVANRALKMFGSKKEEVTGCWRKLLNAWLHYLYCTPDVVVVIRLIKLRTMHGRIEKCIQTAGGQTVTAETTWKTQA